MSLLEALPQFRGPGRRWHHAALERLRHVTATPGYEPAAYPLPDEANASMPAGAVLEARLSLPVASYVLGFSGYSQQSQGFEVQIIDLKHGAAFFQAPIRWNNLAPQGSTQGIAFPVFYLPHPRLVIEPAILTVQIKNLSVSTNQIQFVIHTAEPRA